MLTVESDGVDILVEEQCNVDHQEHDSETLGTNVVWQNFDGVTNKHTGPRNVVPEVVDVDHSEKT